MKFWKARMISLRLFSCIYIIIRGLSFCRCYSQSSKIDSEVRSYSLSLSLKSVSYPMQKSLEISCLVAVVNSLSRFWTSLILLFIQSEHFCVCLTDMPLCFRLSAIIKRSISTSGSFLRLNGYILLFSSLRTRSMFFSWRLIWSSSSFL